MRVKCTTNDKRIMWTRAGVLHCIDGPALIYKTGQMEWWSNGARHRKDGPAVINGDNFQWYNKGRLHRADGPADLRFGIESWYKYGQLHREDGPAVICHDYGKSGSVSRQKFRWHYYSEHLSFEEWCAKAKKSSEDILALKLTYGV